MKQERKFEIEKNYLSLNTLECKQFEEMDVVARKVNKAKVKWDLKQELFRSWWVLAFILFAYVIYVQATQPFERSISELKHAQASLEAKKSNLETSITNLKLMIASQDDPDWVELVLKEKLNRVPEGQVKIIFTPESNQ